MVTTDKYIDTQKEIRREPKHDTTVFPHPCSLQHHSQQSRGRSKPNVHQWMNELIKCGIYIQWNISQP